MTNEQVRPIFQGRGHIYSASNSYEQVRSWQCPTGYYHLGHDGLTHRRQHAGLPSAHTHHLLWPRKTTQGHQPQSDSVHPCGLEKRREGV